MSDPDRLEAIEIKCAHLEYTVQQLNDALYRQQQQLDRLLARHEEIGEALERLGGMAGQVTSATEAEVPPHY
jgi:uncharacterized coiled-coil protein SlyX